MVRVSPSAATEFPSSPRSGPRSGADNRRMDRYLHAQLNQQSVGTTFVPYARTGTLGALEAWPDRKIMESFQGCPEGVECL